MLCYCFHEDFVGWGVGSTVPTTKEERRRSVTRADVNAERTTLQLVPVDIKVYGDIAVVLLVGTYSLKDRASGEETVTTERWLDVFHNDDGRWTWISDAGIDITGAR
jgi:hypothetical protein